MSVIVFRVSGIYVAPSNGSTLAKMDLNGSSPPIAVPINGTVRLVKESHFPTAEEPTAVTVSGKVKVVNAEQL